VAVDIKTTEGSTSTSTAVEQYFYRFYVPPLAPAVRFGDDWFALKDDWFALKAEALARFSGTPRSLIV
jgi:hypothetical protein